MELIEIQVMVFGSLDMSSLEKIKNEMHFDFDFFINMSHFPDIFLKPGL